MCVHTHLHTSIFSHILFIFGNIRCSLGITTDTDRLVSCFAQVLYLDFKKLIISVALTSLSRGEDIYRNWITMTLKECKYSP